MSLHWYTTKQDLGFGQTSEDELDAILKTIKSRKASGLAKETGKFDDILLKQYITKTLWGNRGKAASFPSRRKVISESLRISLI